MFGSTTCFVLSFAASFALVGRRSVAALASVVCVLVVVPLIVALLRIANNTRDKFPA